METQSQNGGSAGPPFGGRDGDGEGEEAQGTQVLALHQILTVHTSNEYIETPVTPATFNGGTEEGNLPPRDIHGSSGASRSLQTDVDRPTSGTSEASRSTGHGSTDSTSSGQRLLGNAGKTADGAVRAQPKRTEGNQEELKPLNMKAGTGTKEKAGKHSRRCDRCHRCVCKDCTSQYPLPTCWLCGQRCLCSAETAVDYATCACCLKALFYHCSSDDEDVCADKPFSCREPHCCVRWSVAGALALFLPCLLCYLPARGCLALCQACHDRAYRPGCRCRTTDVAHHKSSNV